MFSKLLSGAFDALERLLEVEDEIGPADVLMVLAGGDGERELHAARLYRQDVAPVVVISPAVTEVMGHPIRLDRMATRYLRDAGVPAEAILVLPNSIRVSSTYDEARLFAEFARLRGWRKVVVVSDAYHSRRSAMTFRKALGPSVQVIMSPCNRHLASREDLSPEMRAFYLFFESLKLLYYSLRGRLA